MGTYYFIGDSNHQECEGKASKSHVLMAHSIHAQCGDSWKQKVIAE